MDSICPNCGVSVVFLNNECSLHTTKKALQERGPRKKSRSLQALAVIVGDVTDTPVAAILSRAPESSIARCIFAYAAVRLLHRKPNALAQSLRWIKGSVTDDLRYLKRRMRIEPRVDALLLEVKQKLPLIE